MTLIFFYINIVFCCFQKCETTYVNKCDDEEECTTRYVMQCTQTDPSQDPSYGYSKEHCDYEPQKECQTVSENIL